MLLTSGVGMAGLGICLGLFDVAGYRKLARPFEIVGINAIFVFVGSGLLARTLGAVKVGDTTAKGWIYKELFTDHISNVQLASLEFAVTYVIFWWIILWAMARRGWSIRV